MLVADIGEHDLLVVLIVLAIIAVAIFIVKAVR